MCQRLVHKVDTGVCLKIAIQVRDGASNSFISGLFQEALYYRTPALILQGVGVSLCSKNTYFSDIREWEKSEAS